MRLPSLALAIAFLILPARTAAADAATAFAGTVTSPDSSAAPYRVSLYVGDPHADQDFDHDRVLLATTTTDSSGHFVLIAANVPTNRTITIRAVNEAHQWGGQQIFPPPVGGAWPALTQKVDIAAAPVSDQLYGIQSRSYAYTDILFVTDRAAGNGDFANTAATLSTPSAGKLTGYVALASGQGIGGQCGLAGTDWQCAQPPQRNGDAYLGNVATAGTGAAAKSFLAGQLAAPAGGTIMLFVHGFNNSFDQGAQAAARMSFLMEPRPHATLYYSWPSAGGVLGYPADEKSSELSAKENLIWVIDTLANLPSHPRVVLVAHSMGSIALVTAVEEWADKPANVGRSDVFSDMTLFAGDVDEELFRLYQPSLERVVKRIKIYSNVNDQALHASTCLTGDNRPRIGQVTSWKPPILGFDATPYASTSDLGHGYLDSSTSVALDWNGWIDGTQPPTQATDIRKLSWLNDASPGGINAGAIAIGAVCTIFPLIKF